MAITTDLKAPASKEAKEYARLIKQVIESGVPDVNVENRLDELGSVSNAMEAAVDTGLITESDMDKARSILRPGGGGPVAQAPPGEPAPPPPSISTGPRAPLPPPLPGGDPGPALTNKLSEFTPELTAPGFKSEKVPIGPEGRPAPTAPAAPPPQPRTAPAPQPPPEAEPGTAAAPPDVLDEKGNIKWLAMLAPLLGTAAGAAFGGKRGAALGALGGSQALSTFTQGIQQQQARADELFTQEQERTERTAEREQKTQTREEENAARIASTLDPREAANYLRERNLLPDLAAAYEAQGTREQGEKEQRAADLKTRHDLRAGVIEQEFESEKRAEEKEEVDRITADAMRLALEGQKDAALKLLQDHENEDVRNFAAAIELIETKGEERDYTDDELQGYLNTPASVLGVTPTERVNLVSKLLERDPDILQKIYAEEPPDPEWILSLAVRIADKSFTGGEDAAEIWSKIDSEVENIRSRLAPVAPEPTVPPPGGEALEDAAAPSGEVTDDFVIQAVVEDAQNRNLTEEEVRAELDATPTEDLSDPEKREILKRLGFDSSFISRLATASATTGAQQPVSTRAFTGPESLAGRKLTREQLNAAITAVGR